MKLSEILGRIITDVALRQKHRDLGVCALVDRLSGYDARIEEQFELARRDCCQTDTYIYPVLGTGGPSRPMARSAWCRANDNGSMWHGEYGRNRRKLVRDCWRWAKERGL